MSRTACLLRRGYRIARNQDQDEARDPITTQRDSGHMARRDGAAKDKTRNRKEMDSANKERTRTGQETWKNKAGRNRNWSTEPEHNRQRKNTRSQTINSWTTRRTKITDRAKTGQAGGGQDR